MARVNPYDRFVEKALDGELGPSIVERCPPVEKRHGLSVEEFTRDYRGPRRPVILTGLGEGWAAWQKWTFDFFRERLGQLKVVTDVYSKTPTETVLGALIDRIVAYDPATNEGSVPPYLQEWPIFSDGKDLQLDYGRLDHFQGDWMLGNIGYAIDFLWIGPRGAHTWLHQDTNGVHTWNAQIAGKKLWILLGPDADAINTKEEIDVDDVVQNPKNKTTYFVSSPGEIAYIPQGWWHRVKTLEPSINLSGHIIDEREVPRLVKSLMVSNALGWLNQDKVMRADPGMHTTFRGRAQAHVKALGLDPDDVMGFEKPTSFNSVTDIVNRTSPAKPTG